VNPFVYPKAIHVRRERPGHFSRYQRYKAFLQREFERKCVYCRMPDSMKGYESFCVDHYRPKQPFPLLATTYSNLFYSCKPCNDRKGPYWPSKARERTEFIPNPCDHVMFSHLRYAAATVVPKSVAGTKAVEILDLNEDEFTDFRTFILDSLEVHEAKKNDLVRARDELKARRDASTFAGAEVDAALAQLERALVKVSSHLERLSGTTR
jgi:uncharacterized protein (TIGR02646 family)